MPAHSATALTVAAVLAVGSAARHTADVPAVTALLLADHLKITIYRWSTRRHPLLSLGWRLHAALDRRGMVVDWRDLPAVRSRFEPAAPFFAYLAAVVAHSGYTRRFERELRTPGPRVPLTGDNEQFERAVQLGNTVLWLHTYGVFAADPSVGRPRGSVPRGRARVVATIPGGTSGMPRTFSYEEATQTLHVGDGSFAPVTPAVALYEVSGMRVVSKWLNYRLAEPSGRRDSPLDSINVTEWPYQWTLELLDLLWVLEALIELEPAQDGLLDQIVHGPLVSSGQLHVLGILPAPATSLGPVQDTEPSDQLDLDISP